MAIETSTDGLSIKYFFFVFIAVLGIIQAAAAHAGLRGLLFFPWEVRIRWFYSGRCLTLTSVHFSWLFAVLMTAPTLGFFFVWNSYNATGAIEGAQQAGLFVLSVACAGGFSLVASSLINHWRLQHNLTDASSFHRNGLDALRDITWFQAVCRTWQGRKW
ncbi:MAG: hypothetical protein FWF18_05955 [Dehalococcoidia bacterium]|nr:hypothetical protein [Dehalococcoidia bacterium]